MTDRFRLAGFASLFVALFMWGGFAVGFGCTASQAAQGAQTAAIACEVGTVLLDEPGLEPICAAIPEIEAIIAAWLANKSVSIAPKTKADLQKAIIAARAKDGGK